MTTAVTVADAPRGACADRLDLVDATFEKKTGRAWTEMRALCRSCPIAQACLTFALENGEHGAWGGTDDRERRRTVKHPYTHNLRSLQGTAETREAR